MEQTQQLTKIAAALSDPIRVQILDILMQGRSDSTVSQPHPKFFHALCPYLDVLPELKNITRSKLSYHLRELREANLVEEHRQGKLVFHLVNQVVVEQFLDMVKERYLHTPVLQDTK